MEGTALAIEFEQHRLGGLVAWDRVDNLLAVELQRQGERAEGEGATGGGGITLCILEPSCPEVRRPGSYTSVYWFLL